MFLGVIWNFLSVLGLDSSIHICEQEAQLGRVAIFCGARAIKLSLGQSQSSPKIFSFHFSGEEPFFGTDSLNIGRFVITTIPYIFFFRYINALYMNSFPPILFLPLLLKIYDFCQPLTINSFCTQLLLKNGDHPGIKPQNPVLYRVEPITNKNEEKIFIVHYHVDNLVGIGT